jgi:CDP-glucose 4,6-dehydratase
MHAMPDRFSGAWNFGPNEAAVVTVQGLVNHVLEEWGGGAFETPAGRDPHEARTLKLDSSKANTLLGWRQRWTFRQAVSATIDWYRRFFAGEEMYGVSQEQIAAYMSA